MDIAGLTPVDVTAPGTGALIAAPRTSAPRTAALDTSQARDDYSDPVVLLGRLKAGTARESHRVVHVFALVSDLPHEPVVTARCGAPLPADDLQWLPRFAGMPCEPCVMADQPASPPCPESW